MEDKVAQQVSIIYSSNSTKLPSELYELAKKYRCASIPIKGEIIFTEKKYAYHFIWNIIESENATNFLKEARNLEKTLSSNITEL